MLLPDSCAFSVVLSPHPGPTSCTGMLLIIRSNTMQSTGTGLHHSYLLHHRPSITSELAAMCPLTSLSCHNNQEENRENYFKTEFDAGTLWLCCSCL